jgi:hypothetical protein
MVFSFKVNYFSPDKPAHVLAYVHEFLLRYFSVGRHLYTYKLNLQSSYIYE